MKNKYLVGIMSVRNLKTCKFWINKVNFLDKMYITGYSHSTAHKILKDYFLENDYTHLIIYGEDALFTPSSLIRLIEGVEKYDYLVLSGWTNVNFNMGLSNVGMADLRKYKDITSYHQYDLVGILKLITSEEDYIRAFFVGLPLTVIRRDVVEKVTFSPYKHTYLRRSNQVIYDGIMHDTKFAIECADMNIPIMIDTRVFGMHYANTYHLISYENKNIEVIKKTQDMPSIQ